MSYVDVGSAGFRMPESERPAFAGARFRATLLLGSGLAVGSWIFAGSCIATRIADIEAQSAAIATRYAPVNLALTKVSTQRIPIDRRLAFLDDASRRTDIQNWRLIALAVASSLGLAVLSTRYASLSERRSLAQHARNVDLQRELQAVSARLTLVREQERRSIARDLHDEVGQMMAAIKVELAVAQRAIDGHGGGPPGVLDAARPMADLALEAVRDLSHLMHPSALEGLGLHAATEQFVRQVHRRHACPVEFVSSGSTARLAPAVEAAAYHIVQEALTNAAKHAQASAVRVRLDVADRVTITIDDNGAGFDPEMHAETEGPSGLGLVSMRERAAELGGTCAIESAPGHGTRVHVELPARQRPRAAPPDAMTDWG